MPPQCRRQPDLTSAGTVASDFDERNAFGTLTLARFIKSPLKAGTVLTVTVSKPGAINAVKVLTVRAGKAPLVATKCIPPGARTAVSCQRISPSGR